MKLSPRTIKLYGAGRIAKATGLSLRTVYRWAAEGVPGKGSIGAVRKAAIEKALHALKPLATPVRATKPNGPTGRHQKRRPAGDGVMALPPTSPAGRAEA